MYFSLSTRDKVLSATEKTQTGLVFSVERFLFSLDSVISLLTSLGGCLVKPFYIKSSSTIPFVCPDTSPLIKGIQPIF